VANEMISIVVPCCNEEGNIVCLYGRLQQQLHGVYHYEIIFIDDGSTDSTLETIQNLSAVDSHVKFISFSRNFGHQNAIKAGLDNAIGDCVITMDADLQHPPELIPKMIEAWKNGHEIVYTVRDDSQQGSLYKRLTSKLFYKIMNKFSSFSIESGAADFRLLDRSVVEVIRKFRESFLFFRGLIGWLGFRQFGIRYQPAERNAGLTKYSARKMIIFAITGITSFSVRPLHFATIAGFSLSGFALLYAAYALCIFFFTHNSVPGWTSVLVSVLFIGGFQLIVLGIIGEYIGKIFLETKMRPNYIVRVSNIPERYVNHE
jgi:polyisoprenyl-phosphate glycosyltransferase